MVSRKEYCELRKSINKIDLMSFAINSVPLIMTDLHVSREKWAFGGSVAALLYGCNIERCPHDIDIIVPVSIVNYVIREINNNFRYIPTPEHSSVDDELAMGHFAFKTATGPVLDIISVSDEKFNTCYCGTFKVMRFEELIKSKRCYNRQKDREDLVKLEELEEKFKPKVQAPTEQQETTLGDLDALAALKAKMAAE